MIKITVGDKDFEIHPISQCDLDAVLEVYKQCEDFLALGPVPTASMEMVFKDIEVSKGKDGRFCGIYAINGTMIGIIDYVPNGYNGSPNTAFLELLMIALPFRNQGIGKAVVAAIEKELIEETEVRTIFSAVQVNNPHAIEFWRLNGYRIISGPDLQPDQTIVFGLCKELT